MEGKEGCAVMERLNTMMANLNLSFFPAFLPPVSRLKRHRRWRLNRGKNGKTKQLEWTFNKLFFVTIKQQEVTCGA